MTASGCESTQEKAAKVRERVKEKGFGDVVRVTEPNRAIAVTDTTVLSDENGAAAVVEFENSAAARQAAVPIAIDVKDPAGKSVFRNDGPGLDPALTRAALVEGKSKTFWVNDQLLGVQEAGGVEAKIGPSTTEVPAKPPRMEISQVRLEDDRFSGLFARGRLKNESRVEQRNIVIFGIARKGKKIVAAGRGAIRRLKAGRRTGFKIYFIGNPKGAELDVAAPPVILR